MSDLAVGILFFAVLIGAAIVVGGVLQRSATARNRRVLAALAPFVSGQVSADSSNARLDGRYRGRTIRAVMTPGKNVGEASETAIRINAFEIDAFDVAGRYDWEVGRRGLLRREWRVSAADPQLEAALDRTGLVQRLSSMDGEPSIHFSAHNRTLRLHTNAGRRLAPRPDDFVAQLELLELAAQTNAEVNRRPE